MANPIQLVSLIRFQLSQLSAKNRHHEFEHLSYYFAKARICSNILPATGPVSSGGDQGRDFETFRTYLATSPIANSSFIGLISERPIAFACSLEKDIIPKIKEDIKTIMSSGSQIDAIHYFCGEDIPVGKRHGLKSWAMDTYSVDVEIHDGQAISQMLSDREVFWIAERFLDIPTDLFPDYSPLELKQAKTFQRQQYDDIKDYLARNVAHIKDVDSIKFFFLKDTEKQPLNRVIKNQKRIVLLADGGVGKTTELEHIRAFYSKENSAFYPYLILMNTFVNEDITSLLPKNWELIPESNMLIILDGLDEIEHDNHLTAIRRIQSLSNRYKQAHILVSCRTNFYKTETERLEGFSPYLLLELSDKEIDEYIARNLNKETRLFNRLISLSHLNPLLYIPFYLINLVELFAESHSLPESKGQIFEQLVALRFRQDIRKYRTTVPIEENKEQILRALERIAVGMEVLGKNYITEDEFKALVIDNSIRTLVQRSSLLKRGQFLHSTWQFEHNNFQEFMAARVLSRYDLTVIKDFVSLKPFYQKVIPSWVNTLSFLTSILNKTSDRFIELLDWIKTIEPELLLKFERDKVDPATRFQILKTIFEDYKSKELVFDRNRVAFDELAQFGQSYDTVEYLIHEAEKAESGNQYSILFNALELLGYSEIPPNYKPELTNLLVRCALNTDLDDYFTGRVLMIIANLGLHTHKVINQILESIQPSMKDRTRSGLYYLLYESDYLNENIDLFLEGIVYASHNSSRYLINGIQKAKAPYIVRKILNFLLSNPKVLENHSFDSKKLISVIAENAASAFLEDSSIRGEAAGLFIALVNEHLEKEASLLISFFDTTQTRSQVFQELFEKRAFLIGSLSLIVLATLADSDCLEFFANQYTLGHLTDKEVSLFQSYLGWKNQDLYLPFNTLINEKSGNRFPFAPSRDIGTEKKHRRLDDISLLFDKESFIKAVELIFTTENKNTFTKEELISIKVQNWDQPYFSSLALFSLINLASEKSISFDSALETINKSDWGWFCINKLYEYLEEDGDINLSDKQKEEINRWCQSHIKEVNFRDALVTEENGASTNRLAVLLWFFLRHLDLEYPEETLLDLLSFDWIEDNQHIGIQYIEERVSKTKVCKRILENLAQGIADNDILKNHLDYCRRHSLKNGLSFAVREIVDSKRSIGVREICLEIILQWPNSSSNLEKLLPDILDSFKWAILKELLKQRSEVAHLYLKELLNSNNTNEAVRASYYLVKIEDEEGWRFYVNFVEKNKVFRSTQDSKTPLNAVTDINSTQFLARSVPYIFDLLRLSYEEKVISSDTYNPHSGILEILTGISNNSDEFYRLIRNYLLNFITENITTFPSTKYLYYFLEDLDRNYANKATRVSIEEILSKLDQVIPFSYA